MKKWVLSCPSHNQNCVILDARCSRGIVIVVHYSIDKNKEKKKSLPTNDSAQNRSRGRTGRCAFGRCQKPCVYRIYVCVRQYLSLTTNMSWWGVHFPVRCFAYFFPRIIIMWFGIGEPLHICLDIKEYKCVYMVI